MVTGIGDLVFWRHFLAFCPAGGGAAARAFALRVARLRRALWSFMQ